jgi:hypothetical protein
MRELTWDFQLVDPHFHISEQLINQCGIVCADGFGGSASDWIEDNKDKFSKATIFGKLVDAKEDVYGIAFYIIPDQQIFNSHVVWEAICLKKSAQRQGYAKMAVEAAIKNFPDRKFGWLCCTTQNPSMFMRYAKYGKRFFPFHESYETSDGQQLMKFLIQNIKTVQEVDDDDRLNNNNGICTALYPGRLGNYQDNPPGSERFEQQLQEWGFKRETGDAVIMALQL